jgi:hypothetical protein
MLLCGTSFHMHDHRGKLVWRPRGDARMAHASALPGAAAHLMQNHPSCHGERVGGKTNQSYSAR